jgi:hypothetical protein
MPEVTTPDVAGKPPSSEAEKPGVEAIPADGDRVIFIEEGNTEGWISFDPESSPEFPDR